jgi:integrase
VLTEPEAVALIKACSSRAPTGIRNKALIAVLSRSGLRISEALALELRDLDLQASTIRVRHGKATAPAPSASTNRPPHSFSAGLTGAGASPPAPPHRSSAPLPAGTWTPLRVPPTPPPGPQSGIDRRVHAHGLRHTYTAEAAREKTPINVIRDALGHTTLAVTDRYLRDVAPIHVIETMGARRWEGP